MPSPSPAGPRPWLFALEIPSGARGLLIYLWTYGPHWRPGDPEPAHGEVRVWPMRRTICEDFGGVSANTVKTWLRQLARAGLIKRDGNGWALASGGPCADWLADDDRGSDSDTRVSAHPGLTTPGGGLTTPGPGVSKPGGGLSTPPIEPVKEPPIEPAKEPATPSEQAPLVLVPDEPDDFEAIRAEHEQARKLALGQHGARRTKLPSRSSKAGKALDSRLRRALAKHGPEACRRVLAWQARRWAEDPGQLAWSCEQVWTPKCVDMALRAMAEPRRTRGSPRGWVNRWEPGQRPVPDPSSDAESARVLDFDSI